jgi:hypothetical protein
MADYLCAPFPYLVGVHSSVMDSVKRMPLDSVLFCDLDQKMLSGLVQSDLIMLPPVQINALAGRLDRARDKGFGTLSWNQEVFLKNFVLLSCFIFFAKKVQEAFLHAMCSLIGPYRRYYLGLFDKVSSKWTLVCFLSVFLFVGRLSGRLFWFNKALFDATGGSTVFSIIFGSEKNSSGR